MGDTHGGVRRVDRLAAGAAGAVDVDAQVARVDDDLVVILDLGHDEHADGARVDAALRFGDGHALDAVDAALVLQVRPHALVGGGRSLRADRQGDVLEAPQFRVGRAHLGDAPAVRLSVAPVHARQVGGKKRGFFAAFTGLDFEDDVHGVLGVARDENRDERLMRGSFFRFEGGDLLGERAVLGCELAGGLEVAGGRAQSISGRLDAPELGVSPAHTAHQLLVGEGRRIRHLRLDLRVLLQQRAQGSKLIRRGHDSPHPCPTQNQKMRRRRQPSGRRHRRRASRSPSLGGAHALAVASLELGDAAAGVEDLLLARVERVAGRAHVHAHLTGGDGGTGVERVAARAGHDGVHVFGVNTLLHGVSPGSFGAPGPDMQRPPHLAGTRLPARQEAPGACR